MCDGKDKCEKCGAEKKWTFAESWLEWEDSNWKDEVKCPGAIVRRHYDDHRSGEYKVGDQYVQCRHMREVRSGILGIDSFHELCPGLDKCIWYQTYVTNLKILSLLQERGA